MASLACKDVRARVYRNVGESLMYDNEGLLSEHADEAIEQIVSSLSMDEVIQVIMTANGWDSVVDLDDPNPRDVLRLLAQACVRWSIKYD